MNFGRTLNRAKVALRRWWKCRIRRLHFYKFVRKNEDGSRLLRCTRCQREVTTEPRYNAAKHSAAYPGW